MLEDSEEKALFLSDWGHMGMRQVPHQLEMRPQLMAQPFRIIPTDFQSATLLRTVYRERPHDQMAADANRSSGQVDILPTIFEVRQEVKHGPIVPDVELAEVLGLSDVCDQPCRPIGLPPQTGFCVLNSRRGNVEHRY